MSLSYLVSPEWWTESSNGLMNKVQHFCASTHPETPSTILSTLISALLIYIIYRLNTPPKSDAVGKKKHVHSKGIKGTDRTAGIDHNDDDTSASSSTTSTSSSLSSAGTYLSLLDALLQEQVPDSCPMERQRFLKAHKYIVKEASEKLRFTLEWRNGLRQIATDLQQQNNDSSNEPPSSNSKTDLQVDIDRWQMAMSVAAKRRNDTINTQTVIPRVIRKHLVSSKSLQDAHQVPMFLVIPGLLDDAIAEPSTYALAVAWYLQEYFFANNESQHQQISLIIDLRAGQGWRNMHAIKLLPMLKESIGLLAKVFPERLSTCILYPIPKSYIWIWKCIEPYIDVDTRRKIGIVQGQNSIAAPMPIDALSKYVTKDVAIAIRDEREYEFK